MSSHRHLEEFLLFPYMSYLSPHPASLVECHKVNYLHIVTHLIGKGFVHVLSEVSHWTASTVCDILQGQLSRNFVEIDATICTASHGKLSRYFVQRLSDSFLAISFSISRWIFPILCRASPGESTPRFVARLTVGTSIVVRMSWAELYRYSVRL